MASLIERRKMMALLGVRNWLTYSTTITIKVEFGNTDGEAVITATNAYLNNLANTDIIKANTLAGFINEDPMMVCSLGLQVPGVAMPIRFLVGDIDGAAYIDTGFIPGNLTTIEMSFRINRINPNSSHSCLFGSRSTYTSRTITWGWGNANWEMTGDNCFTSWGLTSNYRLLSRPLDLLEHTVKLDQGDYIIDGVSVYKYPQSTFTCPYNLYVYNLRQDGGLLPNGLDSDGYVANVKVWNNATPVREMYPFIRNGVLGMIDVLHNVLYTNAGSGSFTIAYTLSDGTPWTPAT